MWELKNDTPFAAERTWARDGNGAEVWVVVVKGTFLINLDGSTKLAEKQEEVCRVPKYLGEPGNSSLLYESDLMRTKPTTDVILLGHAYAQQEKTTTHVDVSMKIGNVAKTLRVFGDRIWQEGFWGMKMTQPEPFNKMPIIYERAFGGIDRKSRDPKTHGWEQRNPIGTGYAVRSKHLSGQRAPNIEHPEDLLSTWKYRPNPAGFGPIPANWPPRVLFAGTYDEHWEKNRSPLLPNDFDERFYQCSPVDQQTFEYLKGDELVELRNVSADGLLSFRLPRATLGFNTNFETETVHHRANLHTVIIEPDMSRVMMVWHTMLQCHSKVLKLRKTTIIQKTIRSG